MADEKREIGAGARLFDELADVILAPDNNQLPCALDTCRERLRSRELRLYSLAGGSARLLARAVPGTAHCFAEPGEDTLPASLFKKNRSGPRRLNAAELPETWTRDGELADCSMLLVPQRLPGHRSVLLLLADAPRYLDHAPWDSLLPEIADLLFAGVQHQRRLARQRQRGEVLARILNYSDSIYTSWHEDRGWAYHNVRGATRLGYPVEELDLRSPDRNPMHPDDWKEGRTLFETARRQGRGYNHDYRVMGHNGELRWYHAEVNVTERNARGGARELVSISRDISTVREAARAAVSRANLEKWLVAKAKQIFACDDFSSIANILREAGSYLGVDRCTLRVVDPATQRCNLVAEWHKPQLEAMATRFPEMTSETGTDWIRRLVNLGEAYVMDDTRTEPSATLRDYYQTIGARAGMTQPMIHEGQLTGYLNFLQAEPRSWSERDRRVAKEISEAIDMAILRNRLLDELRASEERYRLAVENSTHGLWEHDVSAGTIYHSPHYHDMLGHPRTHDRPRPIEDLLKYVHPEDHHVLYQQAQLEKDQDAVNLEMRHLRRDGSSVWLLSRGRVVERDASGKPLRVVGFNMDISEQRRTLAALRRARETAEEANRSKSEFLQRMSHEIRTPMNAIAGMSHLTLQTRLNEEQRDFMADIQGASESLQHIIDDLLDFSKIEAGQLRLVDSRFRLQDELERIRKLMSLRARQAGNTLEWHIFGELPAYLVGDRHRLAQVLTNLLGNAVKFTQNGGIRVKVDCLARAPRINSINLRFAVEDDGIGMNEEQMGRLFEPYEQAEDSTARKYGGSGLGLSISKHLVEMMGGAVHCSSSPGQGSTFTFNVLLKEHLPEGSSEASPALAASPRTARGTLQDRRVLLAEDNPVNQRVAAGILDKLGVEVVTASNGQEAVNRLNECAADHFDAVLMDVEMPILDGLEACRRIRRQPRYRHLPIIALTAHAMSSDRERCLAAGMNEHLAKPVDPASLQAVLSTQWGEQSMLPEQAK